MQAAKNINYSGITVKVTANFLVRGDPLKQTAWRPSRTLVGVVAVVVVALLAALLTVFLVNRSDNNLTPQPPQLSPSVTSTPRAHELGVSDNLGHLSPEVLNARLQKLKDAGVRWLRKDIEWRGAEPVQGRYGWKVNDNTVEAANRFGMKQLLIVGYAPQWAAGPDQSNCATIRCSPADTPAVIAAFRAFVEQTIRHYCGAPYEVEAIEVWNEPNLSKYWPSPNPAVYVKFLEAADQALKASGCKMMRVMGGLGDINCAGCYSSSDFLAGVYASGGSKFFDAVGNHPYIVGPPTAETWQPYKLHKIMEENGDGNKEVWATEFAYSSKFVGTELQATYMRSAILTFRSYPWAGPFFWFTFEDDEQGGGFGLADPAGTPKQPAFNTFGELARTG